MRWTAVVAGFLFFLREGFYLAQDGLGFGLPEAFRGSDVVFWKEGKVAADYHEAGDVSIRIKSAKADICNAGTSRNHYLGGSDICVVNMMISVRGAFPERFADESEEPVFRLSDGEDFYCSEVQALLQLAAEGVGVDRTRYAVHSLRIGGACALLHAGFSIELVQRWGRRASNAVQAYLWESARRMVASRGSLTVTRQC